MKKSLCKFISFLPILSLCACGYKVKEVFNYSDYNSPDFEANFYRVYSDGIQPGSSNINDLGEYVLDDSKDYVFKSFDDDNFKFVETNSARYQYQDEGLQSEGMLAYGSAKKLSLCDDTFKEGYVSKLFDGQMFCNGKTQKARVQIDEGGFGTLFQKELASYSYFAMNFKASYDFTDKKNKVLSSGSKTVITLNLGFYSKNDNGGYDKKTLKYHFDKVPTNTNDGHSSSCYMFFGFKLADRINIDRCCGLSVSYDLEEGSVATIDGKGTFTAQEAKEMGISHSLMLYEIFLPNSTWH